MGSRPQNRQLRSSARPSTSRAELLICGVGLVLAIISGIVAYQIVGPYGDGPFGAGYRRIPDPVTGASTLVRDLEVGSERFRAVVDSSIQRFSELRFDSDGDGADDVRAHLDGPTVVRVEHDQDGDGDIDRWEFYDDALLLVKVGFSLRDNGVLDAWAYHDQDGQLAAVELSTARDGKVDRWEFYENGAMVRLEEDTTGDGRPDRWSTYVGGILTGTVIDADGDGSPDSPETGGGDPR